jgi:HSP20 family protein
MPSEVGDFADEIKRVFLELGRTFGLDSLAGECSPSVDVFETDGAIEITVDLPGVDPGAVRVIVKDNTVLIAGEKTARRGVADSTFHLVERGFGRFARTVRLAEPCEAARASAVLAGGELRISLPKVGDRRGVAIPITVRTER